MGWFPLTESVQFDDAFWIVRTIPSYRCLSWIRSPGMLLNRPEPLATTETALALSDQADRVPLALELARWESLIEELRDRIAEEEQQQMVMLAEIERRTGNLQRDVESLSSIVNRLEFRLQRLNVADRPLTDRELDDEEHSERAESAAYWAEWRQQRSERESPAPIRGGKRPSGKKLLSLYRTLARLIHPDLATSDEDRARRETIMRVANIARDNGDTEQLERLIATWTRPEESINEFDTTGLSGKITTRKREHEELEQQFEAQRDTIASKLTRATPRDRERYFRNEDESLRRDLANLRLRRRRLLRTLDERRRELSDVSD